MFDLAGLTDAVATQGRVARVVIAGFAGSSPREVGAAMLVWADGQSGSVGGGALEWQAVQRARALLVPGGTRLDQEPLGPRLGQCCGGTVTLLTEVYDAENLPLVANAQGVIARPTATHGSAGRDMPLSVRRLLAATRGQGVAPAPLLVDGWMIEPLAQPLRQVWVWGAGHVGRALVAVLAPLPGLALTWVDIAADRFPEPLPVNLRALPLPDPALGVSLAPQDADHIIVTFSHALDLELCHRLLGHGFASCGVIGSATKSARFASRLARLGHGAAQIARIACPIGDPALGKHPQAIAIGVASVLLRAPAARKENLTCSI